VAGSAGCTTVGHRSSLHDLVLLAGEPEAPWEAKGFTELVPPATLAEAREPGARATVVS
jgi:hypothetical protein